MSHERNVRGLQQHAEKRRKECLLRCDIAIKRLIREGRPVNFNTVSQEGKVSTAWLYRNKEIRSRIEQLRLRQSPTKTNSHKPNTSEDSKGAIIEALKKRIKEQDAEIRELRKQVAAVYGHFLKQ